MVVSLTEECSNEVYQSSDCSWAAAGSICWAPLPYHIVRHWCLQPIFSQLIKYSEYQPGQPPPLLMHTSSLLTGRTNTGMHHKLLDPRRLGLHIWCQGWWWTGKQEHQSKNREELTRVRSHAGISVVRRALSCRVDGQVRKNTDSKEFEMWKPQEYSLRCHLPKLF